MKFLFGSFSREIFEVGMGTLITRSDSGKRNGPCRKKFSFAKELTEIGSCFLPSKRKNSALKPQATAGLVLPD
jgi:hypothetical protein